MEPAAFLTLSGLTLTPDSPLSPSLLELVVNKLSELVVWLVVVAAVVVAQVTSSIGIFSPLIISNSSTTSELKAFLRDSALLNIPPLPVKLKLPDVV